MSVRFLISSFFLLISSFLTAQPLTNSDYAVYINKYKDIAIREMKLYKIPASITLAQGMIESGCGKSELAVESKNHFGIKCQKDWSGEKYYYDDDEKNECFRKYSNVEESYRDHSVFLATRSRYAALFQLPLTDYKGWAKGLKQAGYATNPDYANILIRLIEKNQLHLFDDTAMPKTEVALKNDSELLKHEEGNKPAVKTKFMNEGRIILRKNYKMPVSSDFSYSYTSDEGRKVYENQGVPFVFVKKGDTCYSIAKEFGLLGFQQYELTDLQENDILIPGQMLYLEPKKRKNPERTYIVKQGESMYSISQEKCVRLHQLIKFNKLKPGDEPQPGTEIKLAR